MRVVLLILLLLEFGFSKKIALVIGNSNYTKGYLANPINDAKLIRDTLRDDLDFDVTYETDLSKYEMEKAIRDFSSSLGSDDIALFYYAGHGIQYNRLNYLIPLKANAVTEGQIPSVGVDVNYVLGGMDRAKLAIVLLDACRNNPFSRSFSRGGTRGLAQVSSNQQNYIISYATEAGAETQDGNGENSPYALALKEFLVKPLEVSTLLKKVKNRVAGTTSLRQVPYVDDRYVGEYRLSDGGGSCTKVVNVPATYKTIHEKVKVSDEDKKYIITPAKYKAITKRVLFSESYRIYTWIEGSEEKKLEPKMKMVTEKKVKVSDGTHKIIIDSEGEPKNIKTPPQYKTITTRKVMSPVETTQIPSYANYKSIFIPAKYKTIKIQQMVTPPSTKLVKIPAKYKTVTKKVLVSEATQKTVSVPCSEVN